jgi:hypothetical protein
MHSLSEIGKINYLLARLLVCSHDDHQPTCSFADSDVLVLGTSECQGWPTGG